MKKLILVISLLVVLLLSVAGCPSTKTPTNVTSNKGLALQGAEVEMTNLYPGYEGKFEVVVENRKGEDSSKEIRVSIEPEDDKDLGDWEQLPEEYYSWFDVYPFEFVLEPGESQTLTIAVSIPEDMDYSGKRARCELLVLGYAIVGEEGEVGNVPIGVASEWYIETY